MKVMIIEDELPARAKLRSMLSRIDTNIDVIAELGSVKASLKWLYENPEPDIAFVDIQLSDDHSFEIFRQHPLKCPIIFTTAFDKYLMESFEFNSIDYLLKPITEEKLLRALDKVKKLEQHFVGTNFHKLMGVLHQEKSTYRLLAKKGSEYIPIDCKDIAYIFTDHKISFLKDISGGQFILDKNLTDLEHELDSKLFFRLNRKYIAHIKAIEKFKPDNGKIRVFLKPEVREEVHVSKEMAPFFRKWIGD
jgi:DNA-binding LytR/AlgR family response regulator